MNAINFFFFVYQIYVGAPMGVAPGAWGHLSHPPRHGSASGSYQSDYFTERPATIHLFFRRTAALLFHSPRNVFHWCRSKTNSTHAANFKDTSPNKYTKITKLMSRDQIIKLTRVKNFDEHAGKGDVSDIWTLPLNRIYRNFFRWLLKKTVRFFSNIYNVQLSS